MCDTGHAKVSECIQRNLVGVFCLQVYYRFLRQQHSVTSQFLIKQQTQTSSVAGEG